MEAFPLSLLQLICFGLNAVSRMNFLRVMPNTFAYLKNESGAVEMLGYNKVAENTFPNILPMLTSKNPSELSCISTNIGMSNCPFIWKEYSKQDYYTSFVEDIISSRIMLDYMEKFVRRMSESRMPFFHFTWATALTHDRLTAGALGGELLLQSLKWLKQSGYLENTIFILMSDHGYRLGGIRNSPQGSVEVRLPLMYLVLPSAFKKQYTEAYKNLRENSDKLITTFDLHETLKDILCPENLEDNLLSRMSMPPCPGGKISFPPRGISLFRPIPEYRTCAMPGISMNYYF